MHLQLQVSGLQRLDFDFVFRMEALHEFSPLHMLLCVVGALDLGHCQKVVDQEVSVVPADTLRLVETLVRYEVEVFSDGL